MKKVIGSVSMFILSLFIFTACEHMDEMSDIEEGFIDLQNLTASDIDLSDFDIMGRTENGTDTDTDTDDTDTETSEPVVVEELVKSEECDEIVSGIVEFYHHNNKVATVDFGNGECDGIATVTFVDRNGNTHTKEVPFEDLFEKRKHGKKGHHCEWDDEYDTYFEDREPCFEFQFPFEVEMPDGSIITLESEEDREKVITWYEANPEVYEEPTFVFPITVIFEDGTTETINNEYEMYELEEECFEERWNEAWGDEDFRAHHRPCFEFVFPISFEMPDGSTIILEERKDRKKIRAWYKDNPKIWEEPDLQFPVQVKFEDGTTETIQNEDELEEVEDVCFEEWEDEEPCFEVEFPISLTMPDNSVITLENEHHKLKIVAWYAKNPHVREEPELVFPITITFEDGTSKTINNEEELEEAEEECYDEVD